MFRAENTVSVILGASNADRSVTMATDTDSLSITVKVAFHKPLDGLKNIYGFTSYCRNAALVAA